MYRKGLSDKTDALMNIEGFRNLNQDIETIINKTEAVRLAYRKWKNQGKSNLLNLPLKMGEKLESSMTIL